MSQLQLRQNGALQSEGGPAHPKAGRERAAARYSHSVELDTCTITPYLLRRGVLSADDAVSGRLKVEDISRRHRNFRVRTKDGTGYLVKQVKNMKNGSLRSSLTLEAQVLRFIANNQAMEGFRAYAPTYKYFDPRNLVLVTELIHPATSITKLHLYYGKIKFPTDAAEAAGKLLGRYHKAGTKAIERGHMPFLRKRMPNGLNCPTPQFLLQTKSPSGPAYWQILQNEPMLKRVGELRKRWTKFDGIVHGDARWMNYLLTHGNAPDGGPNLRIIDWEMAQIGDSVWDVASYLGDYVRFAVQVARSNHIKTTEEYLEKPPYPARRQHKSAQAFWDTYCKTRRFGKNQRKDALERVMDYLPYYVIMVGFEMTEAHATTGREFDKMESAHLCVHFAREAAENRETFLKEWIGIDAN